MKFRDYANYYGRSTVEFIWGSTAFLNPIAALELMENLFKRTNSKLIYEINQELAEEYDIESAKILALEIYNVIEEKLRTDLELRNLTLAAKHTTDVAVSTKAIKALYAVLKDHFKIPLLMSVKMVPKFNSTMGRFNPTGKIDHYELINQKSFNLSTLVHEFVHALQYAGKSSQNRNLIKRTREYYMTEVRFGTKKLKKFSKAIYGISVLEREANDVAAAVINLHRKKPLGIAA